MNDTRISLGVFTSGDIQGGQPMYFRSIDTPIGMQISVKRYGNYRYSSLTPPEHRATGSKPVYINSNTPTLYDH